MTAQEVVIVVNSSSPESVRLGRLYARARGVPDDQVIRVETSLAEAISRVKYNRQIQGPVRESVNRLISAGKNIRCIVTVYGIPLRINPVRPKDVKDYEIQHKKWELEEKEQDLEKLKIRLKGGKGVSGLDKQISDLKKEIQKVRFDFQKLSGHHAIAAVDSELALINAGEYSLEGYMQNPEYIPFRGKIPGDVKKVFMVSRIDAPTVKLAEGLFMTAIEVEKTGLKGKLYLDARGLKGEGPYAAFDKDIRRTADSLRSSRLEVILDDKHTLFAAGEAPDAALYCGWYSLAKYKDAFEWSKGAVGYHAASAEARTLHDPAGGHWVKKMLEDGVIASIGPVSEPYLHAFPPPSLFFPLLMSGQYTLAEVFTMSNPFLSWRMILVGDPLYNPYKKNPALNISGAPAPPK
ncbi:MAG: TIGR03790 family protein [Nitrospira sp.]|nr:TIGR03790 family protein [bacterium]MBL7047912.1 TIGR03790 family protein [Nitrospira sp.]